MKNCHFTISTHRSLKDMLCLSLHVSGPPSLTDFFSVFFWSLFQTNCSAHAVPLTFPPLLTTPALEYSAELSKAPLHYWTFWILNYTLKHSSKVPSFFPRFYHQFLRTVQSFNYPSALSSRVTQQPGLALPSIGTRFIPLILIWYLFQFIYSPHSLEKVTGWLLKAGKNMLKNRNMCESARAHRTSTYTSRWCDEVGKLHRTASASASATAPPCPCILRCENPVSGSAT